MKLLNMKLTMKIAQKGLKIAPKDPKNVKEAPNGAKLKTKQKLILYGNRS